MAQKRKPADAGKAEKLRVHVEIDASLRKRLGAYAAFHRCTEGQVIEAALTERLKGFYVGQREPGGSTTIAPPVEGETRQVLAMRAG